MATHKLDNLLNTTTGMTAVKSNQQLKNTTVSVGSVSWFTYAGKKVILYVSTDGYVNFSYFNDTTRQLQVLYTNGTLTYLYKQEGQLESGRRFFKIRVQSYITTTSTSSGYALTYELFLIEGQILFLNVVKIPTQRNAGVPSSSITDGTNKTDLNISVGATAPIQITVEDAGVSQKVSRKKYADSAMTFKFSDLLSTGVNMNQVSTGTITGVDWFSYAGNTVDKIYTLDGSQIGFGQSTGHLKICDKDTGKVSSVYRLEGYLDDGKKFLKLRVTSYTSRSASSYNNDYGNSFKTIFEIFLIEGQILCINIVKIPTQSSYMGASSISDGTHTENIDTSWNTKVPIRLLVKKAGTDQDVYYDIYPPKTYTGISVTTLPAKTVYYPGDTFNSSGIVVSGSTSDGQIVAISKGYTLSGFDSETIGKKIITVAFKQFTTTFEVEVKEDVAAEITNIYSARTDYLLGEEFYFSSLGIKMESGKNKNIVSTAEGITVSGFDSTTTGEKTVTISYGGISKEVTVTVHASATLEVISPKTEYYLYDSDFESPTSQIVYDDGTAENASPTFSGFDSSKTGSCEITVSYRGLSTTYTINVFGTMTANIGKDDATDIVAILDIQAETLTISGTGATKAIEAPSDSWGNYTGGVFGDGPKHYSYVKEVRIEDGITEIYGLCDSMTELVKAILPDSLTTIGSRTFNRCGKLPEAIIPQSCVTIGDNAFNSCQNAAITVLNKDTAITDSKYTFAGVQKIKGHYGSTAQSYADKYNYPFESIDTITKLQITKKPDRTLHIGESLNTDDLEVKITLDTGEETIITVYTIEYDFSTAGEKKVTVSAGGCSDSFTVNVIAYAFSELISTTDGMQVIRSTKNDDGTDTVDGADWFKFNNVTADKLYISGNNWIGLGTSAEQLKICRRDGAVWNVYRQETILDSGVRLLKIRVEGYTYYSGSGDHESRIKYELFLFDNNDMYLNVIQSPALTSSYAGTSSLLCNSETTNLSLNGATEESPIPVSFLHQDDSGLEWGITYKKYAFRTLTGIVATPPQKVRYKVKETFNLTGLIVRAEYDDGTSEELNDSDYTTTTPDMTTYGTKTVTITYLKQTTSFEILVIDVVGIEVTSLPDKTTYYEDDTFSSTGIEVSQVYNDGSKETVTDYSISEPGTLSSGDKNITVTYKTFSAEFTIHVIGISKIEVASMPKKTTYLLKQVLDTSGLVISVEYADGVKKDLTSGYSTSKLDSSEPGNKTITVTYRTHETTFVVHVYGTTKSIRISHYPAKIYYKSGEELDTTGLVVMIVDSQGEERETTEYSVSNLDTTALGEQTITVSYQEAKGENLEQAWFDDFQVYVTKDATNPFMKANADIKITVHWPNGEFKDLTNKDIVKKSMKLKESICNERYFIWGGCISNCLTFQTGSEQFWDSGEEYVPHGDIELYIECEGTKVQLFAGTIDSGKRTKGLLVRTIIAYDHLYKYKNIDVSRWYKNQTTDKQAFLTQKHFRNLLFKYLGIEQEEVTLQYDDAYVPNTWTSGEMKVVDILQDLCLQNCVFGWMNRKGKFRYLKVKPNARVAGISKDGVKTYEYYDSSVHYDIIADDNTEITEGRLWYPRGFIPDPYPGLFSPGDITAQEAYEENIYYIRDSFFVGNDDWIDYVFDADEYGVLTRVTPLMKICYGTPSQIDEQHLYIAQGYKVKVRGNPLTRIGSKIQIQLRKRTPALPEHPEGKYITWLINSYIMSRTMEITGKGIMETYSAENGPYNSNKSQLGKHTQTYKAETRKTRSRLATISYENFSDGSNTGTTKAYLKCVKGIDKDKFTAMSASERRNNTIYAVFKEE